MTNTSSSPVASFPASEKVSRLRPSAAFSKPADSPLTPETRSLSQRQSGHDVQCFQHGEVFATDDGARAMANLLPTT
jgi:hypothetical protein